MTEHQRLVQLRRENRQLRRQKAALQDAVKQLQAVMVQWADNQARRPGLVVVPFERMTAQ